MEQINREEEIKFIDEINEKIWYLRGAPQNDFDAMTSGKKALERAIELNYEFGHAKGLLNLAMGTFIIENNATLAIQQIGDSLQIFKKLDDKKWIANSLITLGLINTTIGKAEAALYSALRGITYFEENLDETNDKVLAYYILGTIYKDLKKYVDSEKYYKIGISNPNLIDSTWSGRIYLGLAAVYSDKENYDEAIKMNLKGLGILKVEQNVIGQSRALNDLGVIYKKKKEYGTALSYFLEALQIRENHKITRFVLTSYIDIAALFREKGDLDEALIYLEKAERVAIEINFQIKLAQVYQETGDIYKTKEDYKKALLFYEKLVKLNIEIHHKDTETKINSLTNDIIKEKEAEIERIKNVELKSAYDIIEIKNKEILDSINYAKRIQFVLLANSELLNANLPEHYVLFKPKDIVSGDFYWATKKEGLFYLAVCDSTGHGVPGAFMSLLNMSFLNEAINEKNITSPNEVFDHIRERLISHMDGGRDGMDAILICFNNNSKTITYSAANNTPIIVRNNKVIELPCDKMPIGKGEKNEGFNNYTFALEKGDNLYLYTDGYADQFGGPDGKKFKYKQLNNVLLSISKEPAKQQSDSLNHLFSEWKGSLEQVDDVCIIGIKI
ncbi:MAG: tetratricopeptide repeat protein [Bacteroidetes bacterium]|nr:tetratricopeptide repeat protein [Bacteroidota bacterium]